MILPFQRKRWGAVPIAFPISDHHGAIAANHAEVDVARVLTGAKVEHFEFSAVPASQRAFQGSFDASFRSPIIRLASHEVSRHQRKRNLIEREIGPLRFESNVPSPEVLKLLIAWKRMQFRRTGVGDIFEEGWAEPLLSVLLSVQRSSFRSMLSVLWAGDRVVAAHFGLASERVWHWWYPAYDFSLHRYSPGAILLSEMLMKAKADGLDWLDFGYGNEAFKWQLANDSLAVASGRAFSAHGRATFAARAALRKHVIYTRAFELGRSMVRSWVQPRP
jgi:CelD/BcsL family acetyltransferase involved in cellulose biosynthesis